MTIWPRHEAYLDDLVCRLRYCAMKECYVILPKVVDILEIVLNGNLDPFLQVLFMVPRPDAVQWRMFTLVPPDCVTDSRMWNHVYFIQQEESANSFLCNVLLTTKETQLQREQISYLAGLDEHVIIEPMMLHHLF